MNKKMTTLSLAFPLFIETFLRTLLMNVDTIMLSRYSDKAVAAVGLIQQFGMFIMILYMMGASGASILVSQNLGAKNHETASKISQAALFFNIFAGIILSIILYLLTETILGNLKLEDDVRNYGIQYFKIYVLFSTFQAISLVFSNIIRSYGYSYTPMFVNVLTNIINIVGNYLLIFGNFGFPRLGVQGVAISTVISQGTGAIILGILVYRKPEINMFIRVKFINIKRFITNILKVGVPAAGEFLSYNLAQILIIYFVTLLGTNSLASYSYASNFTRASFMLAISIGSASQILVGYYAGAGNMDKAYTLCKRNLKWGILFSGLSTVLIAIFRNFLLGKLTQNSEIIAITSVLLLISVFHEIGRPMNLIIIAALRGAGDVKFPVYTGIIMQWSISVTLAYLFGIRLGYGLAGIWAARAFEEWIRGFIMVKRWSSRRWESKVLV